MLLGDRLKQLRTEKKITQDEMANLLSIKRQTYSAYERHVSLPDANVLIKLSDFFDVTVDYLLGVSDFKVPIDRILEQDIDTEINNDEFDVFQYKGSWNCGKRLKELREEMGLTQDEVSKKAVIPFESYKEWESNRVKLNVMFIGRLASLFQCTPQYMLGLTNNRYELKSNKWYRISDIRYLNLINELSSSGRKQLLNFAKILKGYESYEFMKKSTNKDK